MTFNDYTFVFYLPVHSIDLDYVEGDFPTSDLRPASPGGAFGGAGTSGFGGVASAGGFGGDTSNLFQHHFGGIFNEAFSPFNGFGGFGLGSFNNYKPWYKG